MRGLRRPFVVGERDEAASIDFEEIHDAAKTPVDLVVYLQGRQTAEFGGELGEKGFEAQALVEGKLRSPPLQGTGEDLAEELEAREKLVGPYPLRANSIERQHAVEGVPGSKGKRQVDRVPLFK